MEIAKLSAEPREDTGTSASNRLRRDGKIPAVLYGEGSAEPITLDDKELRQVLQGASSILELAVGDGKATTAMLKEIQRDPLRDAVIHVDLMKISMTDKVHANVPITLVGEAPGVTMGGVLQHALWELEIQAMAKDIPSAFEVDVSELDLGGSIHVTDLEMPDGVELQTSADAIVVTILAPTIHVEEEVVEEGELLEGEELPEGEEPPEGAEAAGEEASESADEG